MSIADLRQEYRRASLDQKDVVSDPFEQFQLWFDAAVNAQTPMANAMTLATVSAEGQPSARMVLLKDFDHRGFVFYSNYESRKARELLQNPAAALVLYWIELERQIRIEGFIEKVSEQEADEYFASRPIGSRYAAIASPQSEVIRNRALLESRFEDAQRYHGENPRRPPYWGGYRLTPFTMEFWQGRVDRLHDRVRYARDSSGWSIVRLAP